MESAGSAKLRILLCFLHTLSPHRDVFCRSLFVWFVVFAHLIGNRENKTGRDRSAHTHSLTKMTDDERNGIGHMDDGGGDVFNVSLIRT